MGSLLQAAGFLLGAFVWLLTCITFFAKGDTALGLLALLVPPADIVLPFLISPTLGLLGLGSIALVLIGLVIRKD